MRRTLLQSTVVVVLIVNLFAVTCAGMHTEVGIEWIKEEGVRVEDAGTPEVVELEDGTYRMYFTMYFPQHGFYSALSSDGLEWTLEEGVRLVPGDEYDSVGIGELDIVQLSDGTYRMYYDGVRIVYGTYVWVILSAVSSDGLTWVKESGVRIDRGGPYDLCHASSPEVVKLQDGSYRMYYSGSNMLATSGQRILSAVSSDGITWTKEPGIRIDKGIIHDSFVVYSPDVVEVSDGSYRMYYSGTDGWATEYPWRILSAVSSDGTTWTKEAGIRIDIGGPYDSAHALTPNVIQLSKGSYRMYYVGVNGGCARVLSAFSGAIVATADIDPDTLNLKSNGAFVTAYIELPDDYDVADIDLFTIQVEGIPAITDPKYSFVTDPSEYLVDHDGDGISERMVKLDRVAVTDFIDTVDFSSETGKFKEVTLSITGEVAGVPFEGSDTVKVVI